MCLLLQRSIPIHQNWIWTKAFSIFLAVWDYLLLSKIFVGMDINRKMSCIDQCIIQAARPIAVIVSLQIWLAVQLHHSYRSRLVIDTLHSMFAASYNEVLRFESNAACVSGENILGNVEGSHVLMVADNVNHNTVTINSESTFHRMRMIAVVTPSTHFSPHIPRRRTVDCPVTDTTKVQINDYKLLK